MRFTSGPAGRTPGARRSAAAGLRRRPAQLVVTGFIGAIAAGTALLLLPVSSTGRLPSLVEALFTATSAACVTGLAVVDTGTFWSPFGQVVIVALIQIGGFGVMTVAALLGLLVSRRLGIQTRMVAAESTRSVHLGDVRAVMLGAVRVTLVAELTVALLLAARLAIAYDEPVGRALWLGVFHAVSAFNNAGFALYPDNLVQFVADPWICLPLCLAVIVGGLGFPVWVEVWQHRRERWLGLTNPHRWSLHFKVTTLATAVLLGGGTLFFLLAERTYTLAGMDAGTQVLASFTQSAMARTAGFNSLDTSAMNNGTWLGTDVLMFIGGGSAGTAGGIKVGTFAILAFIIWSELRGDPDSSVFDRRVAVATQRQALAVALLSVAAVVLATLTITLSTRQFTLDQILFETTSAFSTTGLSTGITADLEPWHQVLLVLLMFLGRLGPVTLGTTIALRARQRLYRRPESTMVIG
ncbi:TrkH family potassium uptake protein [Promicromonospora sp. NPDC019610]|uniref:TrkH family potassium uptake protein n=1 Tax=Promicromonospora sp. NPDC019610 TaxID=3364405 RepID=UPI0037BB68F7